MNSYKPVEYIHLSKKSSKLLCLLCVLLGPFGLLAQTMPGDSTRSVNATENSTHLTRINLENTDGIELSGTTGKKAQLEKKSKNSLASNAASRPGSNPSATNQGSDSTLMFRQQGNATWVYSRSTPGKHLPSHGSLKVSVPASEQVIVQARTGNLSITQTDASFQGSVQQGDITLTGTKGKVDLSTRKGNIAISESLSEGSILTGEGDIVIENSAPFLSALTQKGKVTRKFTKTYFQPAKKAANASSDNTSTNTVSAASSPLVLGSSNETVEIETLPYGADLTLNNCQLSIGQTEKKLTIKLDHTPARIQSAQGQVRIEGRNSDLSLEVANKLSASDEFDIWLTDGNLTLILPAGFKGTLILIQEQFFDKNQPVKPNLISTPFAEDNQSAATVSSLAKEKAEGQLSPKNILVADHSEDPSIRTIRDEQGKPIISRTEKKYQLGSSPVSIRIQVQNGSILVSSR